jgi:Tol biopolymer transport system component
VGLPGLALSEKPEHLAGTITFIRIPFPQPYTVETIELPKGKTQQLVQATIDRPEIRDFCYSPDGTYFLVTMGSGDNWYANTEIYIGEKGCKKLKKLTDNNIYDGDPAWSPDGKRIALTRGWGIDGRVLVIDLGLGQEQQVPTIGLRITRFPAWLPDSRRLVVTAKPLDSDHGMWGFAEINISKGAVRWLYKGNFLGDHPSVSPDGTKIAFILQKRPKRTLMSYIRRTGPDWVYRIKILDLNAERIRPVGDGPEGFEQDLLSVWSPDGKQLAWFRRNKKKRTFQVLVYNFEVKKLQKIRLPGDTPGGYSLVWSPDGKHLACVTSEQPQSYTLRVVTLKSGKSREVLTSKSQIQLLYWHKSETTLARRVYSNKYQFLNMEN